jgi:hypothetical protein
VSVQAYLDTAVNDGVVSRETADKALRLWESLHDQIRPPSVGISSGGHVLYTWDAGVHHLEIEIFANEPMEFFYLNRSTDEDWLAVGDVLPDGLAEKIATIN